MDGEKWDRKSNEHKQSSTSLLVIGSNQGFNVHSPFSVQLLRYNSHLSLSQRAHTAMLKVCVCVTEREGKRE